MTSEADATTIVQRILMDEGNDLMEARRIAVRIIGSLQEDGHLPPPKDKTRTRPKSETANKKKIKK